MRNSSIKSGSANAVVGFTGAPTVRQIAKVLTAARTAVTSANGKARERLITADDAEGAVLAHIAMAKKLAPGMVLYTREHGGGVPNAYKYSAEATWAEIVSVRDASGALRTEVFVARIYAVKCPGGCPASMIHEAGALDSVRGQIAVVAKRLAGIPEAAAA